METRDYRNPVFLIPDERTEAQKALDRKWIDMVKSLPSRASALSMATEMLLKVQGHPPMSAQLRGKYTHRHKNRPRRQHAFRRKDSLVTVKRIKMTGVRPVSVSEMTLTEGGTISCEVTFSYDSVK